MGEPRGGFRASSKDIQWWSLGWTQRWNQGQMSLRIRGEPRVVGPRVNPEVEPGDFLSCLLTIHPPPINTF